VTVATRKQQAAAPGSRAARAAANIERQRIKQEKAKERRQRRWAFNLARLQQAYPEVFDAEHPKPLAIDCHRAIRAAFGRTASSGLGHWTHRTEYLRALAAPDAQRHTLDGTPIEPVSAEHREHALQLLEEQRLGQS
jgi:hypothetical protein